MVLSLPVPGYKLDKVEKLVPEKSGRPTVVVGMPGEVGDKGVGTVPCKKTCQVSSKPRWPTAGCPLRHRVLQPQ